MAQFQVNSYRFDPYKNFKFRVKWDGKYVAGISKVSMLKRTTEVAKHREANGLSTPFHMPTTTSFEAITLERGVTHDPEFENWANLIYAPGAAGSISLKNFRKDIIIELLNENGVVAKAYNVYRCWVSEYHALPDLDANANAVAIEMLKLENEGWDRDLAVVEPTQT
ncbi:phage tail protein [Dyella humicola]|uniref:phage tail protein n=1 Tax=Dyella humicola TaxID=2992126 RepID=UPI0022594E69|nr:phage tail protein [Dyella humicola]